MHKKMLLLVGASVFCGSTFAAAEMVKLEQGQARALLGSWEGAYTCDTGYRGRSTLNLTDEAGRGRVHGFFEYRYGGSSGGQYDRHPDEGTITGVIKPDGRLHFGSWDLTLQSTSGDEHTFETRQRLAGYPCNFTWRKGNVKLASADGTTAPSAKSPVLAAAPRSVPLPQDTRVVAPAAGVSPERAAFSGAWHGVWDDTLEHVLVVERITPDEVQAIYAYGDAPSWNLKRDFYRVENARFDGNTLVLKLPRPATVIYRMRSDGTIDANYEWRGGTVDATLRRLATVGAPSVASSSGGGAFALTGLDVPQSVEAGEFYTITFQYEAPEAPAVKQVCFPAAGRAASCWDSFTVDPQTKSIRTQSRIGAPGTYTLTGYVEYEDSGETVESNQVSTQVTVR